VQHLASALMVDQGETTTASRLRLCRSRIVSPTCVQLIEQVSTLTQRSSNNSPRARAGAALLEDDGEVNENPAVPLGSNKAKFTGLTQNSRVDPAL
jgi:hypothetical protein